MSFRLSRIRLTVVRWDGPHPGRTSSSSTIYSWRQYRLLTQVPPSLSLFMPSGHNVLCLYDNGAEVGSPFGMSGATISANVQSTRQASKWEGVTTPNPSH